MAGMRENVGYDQFPKQTAHVGKRVMVFFGSVTDRFVCGVLVRQDDEAPWEEIVRLDNGNYVRGTAECRHVLLDEE